jgi:hypothetical protein
MFNMFYFIISLKNDLRIERVQVKLDCAIWIILWVLQSCEKIHLINYIKSNTILVDIISK